MVKQPKTIVPPSMPAPPPAPPNRRPEVAVRVNVNVNADSFRRVAESLAEAAATFERLADDLEALAAESAEGGPGA